MDDLKVIEILGGAGTSAALLWLLAKMIVFYQGLITKLVDDLDHDEPKPVAAKK